MFDILADQTDSTNCIVGPDYRIETRQVIAETSRHLGVTEQDIQPTFRSIKVLMVETQGSTVDTSIIEQCLRYMVRFECQITQAGSLPVAEFALQADEFDLVVADAHSFELVAKHADVPTIIVAGHPSSERTRNALAAGALHCLPLADLSPRLLEIAVNQALSDET
jgi:DNA-binding NtrC family response regulator